MPDAQQRPVILISGSGADSQSVGARAYKLLADEFLQNNKIPVVQLNAGNGQLAEPVGV